MVEVGVELGLLELKTEVEPGLLVLSLELKVDVEVLELQTGVEGWSLVSLVLSWSRRRWSLVIFLLCIGVVVAA